MTAAFGFELGFGGHGREAFVRCWLFFYFSNSNFMKKDSLGNPLPQGVFLPTNATHDELGHALMVNTFNLAASVALENGKTVIYDGKTKSATILDPDGAITFISHG